MINPRLTFIEYEQGTAACVQTCLSFKQVGAAPNGRRDSKTAERASENPGVPGRDDPPLAATVDYPPEVASGRCREIDQSKSTQPGPGEQSKTNIVN